MFEEFRSSGRKSGMKNGVLQTFVYLALSFIHNKHCFFSQTI